MWALARMAQHAAGRPAPAGDASSPPALPPALQQQLWVLLTGQVMLNVMNVLANAARQVRRADPLRRPRT